MTARSALEFSPGAAGPVLDAILPPDDRDDLAWQDAALCAEVDPEIFYPEKGGSTDEPKAVCRACPVRKPCLEFALDTSQTWGVWGGMSERQRYRIGRQIAGGRTLAEIIAEDDARFYARQEAVNAGKAATRERWTAVVREQRHAARMKREAQEEAA